MLWRHAIWHAKDERRSSVEITTHVTTVDARRTARVAAVANCQTKLQRSSSLHRSRNDLRWTMKSRGRQISLSPQRNPRRSLMLVLLALLSGFACGPRRAEEPALKHLQQQQSGDYVVTVLNETGQIKQGPAPLRLEFRKTSDQQLTDVGDVQVSAAMPMAGMSDMVVDTSVKRSPQAGRYELNVNFSMAGTYRLTATFAGGQQVRFELQVT